MFMNKENGFVAYDFNKNLEHKKKTDTWFILDKYIRTQFLDKYTTKQLGSLLLVEVCGPVEVIDEGLWPNCCSCDSISFERSYSFSLFMFLPKWFYMIRFFKEKTFIIVAAITVYAVNLHSAIMDEVTGLDSSGIWLWCEDVLLYQNVCLLMMLDVLVTDCMVSPITLVVAVCFLLVFSYGDVWVYIGWSLCITPCIQSMSLARGKAVRTAFYYGLGCLGILLSVYCSVFA
ncbi:hypothetical protein CTI12_AA007700 [Artemisia annua]|uniref:Uncharacterized protein n=1 Tax=Artemisia annua TaxID=35608 RepID=A0A2U1QJL5_ARTAN|nr:hypothetical protein CTI12_AA007700 [Artemisia annua]